MALQGSQQQPQHTSSNVQVVAVKCFVCSRQLIHMGSHGTEGKSMALDLGQSLAPHLQMGAFQEKKKKNRHNSGPLSYRLEEAPGVIQPLRAPGTEHPHLWFSLPQRPNRVWHTDDSRNTNHPVSLVYNVRSQGQALEAGRNEVLRNHNLPQFDFVLKGNISLQSCLMILSCLYLCTSE